MTSFSSAEKSSRRKVSCQDPWDSGNDHRAKWRLSAGTQFRKRSYTLVLYSQPNSWLSCDLGKIYNADANMCSLLILSYFVSYTKTNEYFRSWPTVWLVCFKYSWWNQGSFFLFILSFLNTYIYGSPRLPALCLIHYPFFNSTPFMSLLTFSSCYETA